MPNRILVTGASEFLGSAIGAIAGAIAGAIVGKSDRS
jgi:outer membrane lipoprotein SlyB